ncbi:MAG TPA: hypothetical protein VGL90_01960 [Casimicrobiaceae bacterium]|jgi:hypothetical protein|nr:hypothetical protein [Casimicrobiaceae bacterium]
MSTLAIDTYRLLTALKGTGKSANFTAEEIAGAVHVAQQGGDLLTKAEFGVRMDAFEKRMDAFVARLVAMEVRFDAKLEEVRADLRADIKASQTQNLLWLSGLVLASNGMVIALLARLAHVI